MFGHRTFLRIGDLPDATIKGLYRETYELLSCNYSFSQGIDKRGKAQTEVRGGAMHLIFPGLPPDEIVRWMLNPRKYENGTLVLCDADNSPLEKVVFKEAACVEMTINYVQVGTDYVTTQLTLIVKELQIGGVRFENRWI